MNKYENKVATELLKQGKYLQFFHLIITIITAAI
jgi:hypothetical protein